MKPAMRRIKQLTIGLLAILSLSVSSVAACMCSHHEPSEKAETRSCHGPAKSHHAPTADTPEKHSRFSESCTCLPLSTDLSVKSEGFKLKKHAVAAAEVLDLAARAFYSPTPVGRSATSLHLYRRRSDRPPSSRGPPLS